MKKQIYPAEIDHQDLYQFVIGSIAPRPIAFISTISLDGIRNLAPYSFFNVFSVNPFIIAFSTSLKPKTGKKKDTLQNIRDTGECVVNMVSQEILHQMSITSADYDKEIDEFDKAGFTSSAALYVKPPIVNESKVNLECTVNQIIELGHPPTGYLVICNVLRMIINEDVIEDKRVNPHKIDLVGRLGRNFYSSTSGTSTITVNRPIHTLPVGFDLLPSYLKTNAYLTGEDLSHIANLPTLDVDIDLEIREDIKSMEENDFIQNVVKPLLTCNTTKAYTILKKYYTSRK